MDSLDVTDPPQISLSRADTHSATTFASSSSYTPFSYFLFVDHSFPQITSERLNGSNYLSWSLAVETYLLARGKVFLIEQDPPSPVDPTYDRWRQDDALIRSLLWQSIWDHAALIYSGVDNLTRLSSTYFEWIRLHRGDASLSDHYSRFISLCQQLDTYMPLTTDLAVLTRQRDQFRAVHFLESLGPEFLPFRQQLLGSGSLPSISEIYSCAQQCLPSGSSTVVPTDGSALAAYDGGFRSGRGGSSSGRGRGHDFGSGCDGGRGRGTGG
ncbi:uncharacterized protein LOC143850500 [Tasmannia lanceolata]|uniref:uncharacterized protein LOC143850500 n=1 Tax=Tasmannia lanceolata TaxID=3420 RepID=UPI004064B032